MRRIVVVGNTGSGKTTLAAALARRMAVPHVELDALWWQEGWTESDPEVFRRRLAEATAGDAWVVCGNYHSHAADLVWPRADVVVWLDYPMRTVLARLVRRSVRRIVRREELWNGNTERLGSLLSRDSLVVWAFKSRPKHRRRYPDLLAARQADGLGAVRLRSPAATARWLAAQHPR